MNIYTRILSVIVLLCGVCLISLADRGTFGKKSNVNLNIDIGPAGSLKNSMAFNLKSGLQYKGSVLLTKQKIGGSLVSEALISYKKGNTYYIIPYKQKVLIPKYSNTTSRGFTINLGK